MAFLVTDTIQRESDLWRSLQALPKIELHRHLEGSIRLDTLLNVAKQFNISVPADTPEELQPYVQVTKADAQNLIVFLEKFGILRKFFLDPQVIKRVVREAIEDAAADNIRYMELRFTPNALAKAKGYDLTDVVGWVVETSQAAGEANRIRVNLIASMNRHEGLDVAKATTEAALAYKDQNIVGLDLAGKEPGFPARPFSPYFRQAKKEGLGITIHAGEWEGPENIADAILNMSADRIGHGVRIVEDSYTAKVARQRGVFFEVCPTSNIQTGVIGMLQHHPLLDMRYLDLPITINTDDPAVCQTTLTDEYALAMQRLNMPLRDIRELIITAAKAAFIPEHERHELIGSIRRELGTSKYRGLEL